MLNIRWDGGGKKKDFDMCFVKIIRIIIVAFCVLTAKQLIAMQQKEQSCIMNIEHIENQSDKKNIEEQAQTTNQENNLRNKEYARFLEEIAETYPELHKVSSDEAILILLEKLALLKGNNRNSDLENLVKAIDMIYDGVTKGTKGILIIGWIGGKYAVIICGQFFYVSGGYIWRFFQKITSFFSRSNPEDIPKQAEEKQLHELMLQKLVIENAQKA